MSLNDTASGERLHIGFFGLRNAGKSSLVNAVTGQELALVSEVKGTTTDPVKKAMELLPLGPVVIIDTPGVDDEGELGEMRVRKARQTLSQTDLAVLVVDGPRGLQGPDRELLALFRERNIPALVAYNKADLVADRPALPENSLWVNAVTGENIHELKEALGRLARPLEEGKRLVADLLTPGDRVVLVTPIDADAPKGRLILPQQQVLRDVLDARCLALVCQPEELSAALAGLTERPRMVITDSQAFGRVSREVPADLPLTSFSILFARYKGDLPTLVEGAARLRGLKTGDPVLISEGCTHHRQCGDIGSEKMPRWIREYCGGEPKFSFSSGGDFPENLSDYALIVHCGGCMLNEKEMQYRIQSARAAGTPIVNYGVAIAQMHGILRRSLEPFPQALALLDGADG